MKNNSYNTLIFLFIWLCTGFTLGTLTLLWPVRWWVTFARANQYAAEWENAGVLLLIALLIGCSFWLSRQIFLAQRKAKQRKYTLLSAVLPLVLALGALTLFMQPELINDQQNAQITEQFTIGPYPTEEKMAALKEQGYTAIISLLHPAVVPFEPTLMAQEEELAKKYNMNLIQAPMLPWVSDNEASLNRIKTLAQNKNERYYVHCYLGKDRVNLVKNLLVQLAGEEAIKIDKLSANRTFEQMKNFERGDLYRLAPGIYFTPYPTKEEFLAFFLAGDVKSVINLMDSTNVDHQKRIKEEYEILKNSDIQFQNYILNVANPNLKNELQQLLTAVNKVPKPVVVHHWNTVCPEARLFIKEFAKQNQQKPINLNQNHAANH
jgi:protein tyrosine phosphatase (PTP) superfamily phosphohydrolase (DUF442 family)